MNIQKKRRKSIKKKLLKEELFTPRELASEFGVTHGMIKLDFKALKEDPVVQKKLEEIQWEPSLGFRKTMAKHLMRKYMKKAAAKGKRKSWVTTKKQLKKKFGLTTRRIDVYRAELAQEQDFKKDFAAAVELTKEEREARIKESFGSGKAFTAEELAEEFGLSQGATERQIREVIDDDNLWAKPKKLALYKSQYTTKYARQKLMRKIIMETEEWMGHGLKEHVQNKLAEAGVTGGPYYLDLNELLKDKKFREKHGELTEPEQEMRHRRIIEALQEGPTTIPRLAKKLGIQKNTLRGDLKELKKNQGHAFIIKARVKHESSYSRQKRKQMLFEHVMQTDAKEHEAAGGDVLEYYRQMLGVDWVDTVQDYVVELFRHKDFRDKYSQLFEPTVSNNIGVVAKRMMTDPHSLTVEYCPYYGGRKGKKAKIPKRRFANSFKLLQSFGLRKAKHVLKHIARSVQESRSAEEERERIYDVYLDHGVTPLMATVLASALDLPQRTKTSMLDNWKRWGFQNSVEKINFSMLRHRLKLGVPSTRKWGDRRETTERRPPRSMEARKKKFYDHVTRTIPSQNPAREKNTVQHYMDYLGIKSQKTMLKYVGEFIGDKVFRDSFGKLVITPGELVQFTQLKAKCEPVCIVEDHFPSTEIAAREKAVEGVEKFGKKDRTEAQRVLRTISDALSQSRTEQQERDALLRIHAEHGVDPFTASVLAEAMGVKQRTREKVFKAWKRDGYHRRKKG
ncbi:MAG: hypothetical protein KAW41_06175 [Candidatus Diapherotrites archaeon]|nr:hypothetical protein [Candidatus Diapherotrites archaeon]